MIYLGIDKVYPISHHNMIISNDYKKNVMEITKSKVLSSDPTIYIQNPSVTDKTLAPEGKSAIYILVPVPNNTSDIEWRRDKFKFRDLIIRIIKEKTELKDIDDHIEVEKIITPVDWEREYNIYNGAVYSFEHKMSQMFYYRPHNMCQEFTNCYLTGGGTHPGSGLPMIYESGRIAANMIMLSGMNGYGYKYNDKF
jgi:phytoene desaturase